MSQLCSPYSALHSEPLPVRKQTACTPAVVVFYKLSSFSNHSQSNEILTRLSQRDNDEKAAETQASLSKPFEDLVNKGSAHDF